MNPVPPGRTYYPALDVLRGIAILMVVIYHNFETITFFDFGWMGVDLFFVLSGFLITDILLSSKERRYFFRNFYARRFLRIFPLYYLILILFYTLSPVLFSEKQVGSVYDYYQYNQSWFWLFTQNWLFVEKGMAPMPYLSHFWSLAVEEQFYFVWPLVVFLVKDLRKLRYIILTLVVVALLSRMLIWLNDSALVEKYYCNTFTRMDSLLMGALLSVWMKEGKSIQPKVIKIILFCSAVLIAVALLWHQSLNQNNPLLSTIGYTLLAMCFASLLYLFIKGKNSFLNWLKTLPILNYIGKISFGMYVCHIPIYLVLNTQCSRLLATNLNLSNSQAMLLVSFLSVAITIAVSSASYYFFEKPILNLKRHFQ